MKETAEQVNEQTKKGSDPFLRLPYGLAKSKGINTDGLTPRQVWELLKEKGISPQREMAKLSQKLDSELPQNKQDEPEQFFEESDKKTKGLDDYLIRRANNSSYFYEAGDSIKKEYDSFVNTVNSSHFDQSKKDEIISKATTLFNEELSKKASSPHWAVTGRANLNQSQYQKKQGAFDKAFSNRKTFTSEITAEIDNYQKAKAKDARNTNLRNLIIETDKRGEKQFTFEGQTFYKYKTNWSTKKPEPPTPRGEKKMSAMERYWAERELAENRK